MAFDLAKEYKTLLDKRFTQKSLTEQFCGHDFDWNGVNSIAVWTLDNMPTYTYTKTGLNRFTGGNAPANIGGETNEYTLSHDISFGGIIEGYDNADRKSILKANAIMKQQWDEVIVPEMDKYRLKSWANGAGTVVVNSTALTNSTIVRKILAAQAAMNNRLVGRENRVCFITESMAVECKLASELQYNDSYTTKTIVNGQVSRLGSLPIVAVPDDYMPSGVEFMIKWKRASVDPQKLKLLRVLPEVQGVYGPVLEGLVRHDSFVLAQKAYGIYVYAQNGVTAAPTAALSSSKIALSCTDASAVIKYTDDGTNPKTSSTAKTYTAALTVSSSNKLLRFYAADTGKLASGIVEVHENDVT